MWTPTGQRQRQRQPQQEYIQLKRRRLPSAPSILVPSLVLLGALLLILSHYNLRAVSNDGTRRDSVASSKQFLVGCRAEEEKQLRTALDLQQEDWATITSLSSRKAAAAKHLVLCPSALTQLRARAAATPIQHNGTSLVDFSRGYPTTRLSVYCNAQVLQTIEKTQSDTFWYRMDGYILIERSMLSGVGPRHEVFDLRRSFVLGGNNENATAVAAAFRAYSEPPKQRRDVVMACAFNHKEDFQRGTVTKPSRDYIHLWYDSIHKHPGMKGVVFSNMFDDFFRLQHGDEQVEFLHIDPATHPSFVEVPHSDERSINDQKYFVAEWYLNHTLGNYDYALLTDVSDVEFLNDPFTFMKGVDVAMSSAQLFVQEEYKPSEKNFKWLSGVWKRCFKTKLPLRQRRNIFNAGVLGGHVQRMMEFLQHMTHIFQSFENNRSSNCNMVVFGKVLVEKYHYNFVTGWPFHTKFKQPFDPRRDGEAFIKHK